jgi:hypothetical protein
VISTQAGQLTAGVGGRPVLAVHGLGQDAGARGLADAAAAREEQRVGDAILFDGVLERAGDVLLADDVVEDARDATCERGRGRTWGDQRKGPRHPRHVAPVHPARDPRVVAAVPQRLQERAREVGLAAARRARVHVVTVRPGRPHHRGVPALAQREVVRQPVQHRDVLADVITHRLRAEARVRLLVLEHEAVVLAEVELVVARLPAVRRVLGLELRHLEHRHRHQVDVQVLLVAHQPVQRLALDQLARAEVVVEGPVLHHQHDDVVDAREQLLRRQLGPAAALVDRRARRLVAGRRARARARVARAGLIDRAGARARGAVLGPAAGRRDPRRCCFPRRRRCSAVRCCCSRRRRSYRLRPSRRSLRRRLRSQRPRCRSASPSPEQRGAVTAGRGRTRGTSLSLPTNLPGLPVSFTSARPAPRAGPTSFHTCRARVAERRASASPSAVPRRRVSASCLSAVPQPARGTPRLSPRGTPRLRT